MRTFGLSNDRNPPSVFEHSRSYPESEWELEELLNANSDLLLDEDLLLFGRQYRLDSGILDLLALDQFGNTVIFEIKRGKSGSGSASEETILSQPQTYAQSVSTCDYDDLNEIYHEYRTTDWYTSSIVESKETLGEAFETVFGTTIESEDYNERQRMVIVAETVTQQTVQNARYLLEEGLNIQCLEIRQFVAAANQPTIATNTVVDYSLERVQPEREESPIYSNIAKELAQRSFTEIKDLVDSASYHEAFESLDGYEPGLRSMDHSHPESVKYVFHLRPQEWGSIGVALHISNNDEDALQVVRDHAGDFEEQGFEASQTRKRDRIVREFWDVDSPNCLHDDDFIEKVAERFATLVQAGHEVFEMSDRDQRTR